jgi:hypothetical protein
MDRTLAEEWERLCAEHVAALEQYLWVHGNLIKRMRGAAQGLRRSTPIGAYRAALTRLERAHRAMHAFCASNAEHC